MQDNWSKFLNKNKLQEDNMLYKFEVCWTEKFKSGALNGIEVDQRLGFPTKNDVKRHLSYLLNRENTSNISVKLNKSACLSDIVLL
jgi:hypothetical protein